MSQKALAAILRCWPAMPKPQVVDIERCKIFAIRTPRCGLRHRFCSSSAKHFFNQQAPKGPPNQDPSKSGLRLSFLCFSALLPKRLFCRQLSSPKPCVVSIRMSSSLLKCLILMVASVVKSPIMIRVTLSCVDGPSVSRPSGCCWVKSWTPVGSQPSARWGFWALLRGMRLL